MLVARIYGLMWLFAAAFGGVLYFTDSFNTTTSLVFGFIVTFLGGAGLLVVFPAMMAERHSPAGQRRKSIKPQKPKQSKKIYGGKQATV